MRSRNYIFNFIGDLMLVLLMCSNLPKYAFGGDFNPSRLEKLNEEDRKWSGWLKKYIKDVLYVGMPVDKFVRLFTKDESWSDSESPYIISQKDNKYIISGINKNKFRATFKDGALERLELYGLEKFPMLFPHYMDVSTFLKGYKSPYAHVFYDGMPEEEFLKVYSDAILVHKNDWYIIKETNGHKWKVIFKDGYLIGYGGEKTF